MSAALRDKAAIVGIGTSPFGRHLPQSQLALAATAFKAALDDAGLERSDVDGLSIHIGWPLGVDYDQVAQAFGLEIGFVNQAWTHGRFVTGSLQTAAMAVATGMAEVVACVNVLSFTRERDILGGPHDFEGYRETGGTHAETPHYGLTAPAGGAALAMQRYMALYGTTSADLAAVPVSLRAHARRNPAAVMQKPLTVADHQASRLVVDPLHLFDCCIISDGAAVVLVTSAERAADLRQRPISIAGMQGMRVGREEFIFAPPGLGINQQTAARPASPPERDLAVYRSADIPREAIQGLYTYDAFSPLVLFVLERFGFCAPGEAGSWVQGGRIGPGGSFPVNTSGGLLSEAHVAGWNSICEMVRQLRGSAGARQMDDVRALQWATAWGDSVILRN
jgi:acetyl-CoA acetyltransferase